MMETKKSGTFICENSELVENIKRKRPSLTRLDIEKLFGQSVELTEIHSKLQEQNKKLKKEYQKVEQAKNQRQQFISQVEKIVKQKSHELTTKGAHQSSWLVYKLHQKIFDLKEEIQNKEKVIKRLHLSKENQILFRKQVEIECLKEINQYAQLAGFVRDKEQIKNQDELEEIVWMDDYLQTEKQKIEDLEGQLEQTERQTKRLLTSIALKKADIKKMKEVQREYLTIQQNFMQEKKKKEEKTIDNKSYLTNLMKERDVETQKLEQLAQKRIKIEKQESEAIKKLQHKLQSLKQIYQKNKNNHINSSQKSVASIKQEKTEHWVKRVAVSQVETIAKNLNHSLALKGVTQEQWISQFFKDRNLSYSIEQVIHKLEAEPFNMQVENEIKLLARYVIEDNDTGLMLEDMTTSQSSAIIRSILGKLLGPIKVYNKTQIGHYQQELGQKLHKYWSLVEQSIHIKEGNRNLVTREMLEQGIHSAELEFTHDEIDFMVLYLYSWSRDIMKLELNKLGRLTQLGINEKQ